MAPLASDWRGGFQGYFRRASGEVARQFMTPTRKSGGLFFCDAHIAAHVQQVW